MDAGEKLLASIYKEIEGSEAWHNLLALTPIITILQQHMMVRAQKFRIGLGALALGFKA